MTVIQFGKQQCLAFLIVTLFVMATNSKKNDNVCRTPECIKISQTILSEMDTNADPCEDMYQYACGSWHKKVNRSANHKLNEVSQEITSLSLKNLKDESPTLKGNFSKSVFKAQTFFKNCIDLKTIDELGTKPLIKLINQLGSWTVVECDDLEPWVRNEWDFSETLAKIHNALHEATTFWKLQFKATSTQGNKVMFTLTQSPLTLGFKKYYAKEKIELHKEVYLEYATRVGELLGGFREIVREKMKQVFALEQRLSEISDDDTGNPDPLKNKHTTLDGMKSMFGDLIDWKDYLSRVYSRKILNCSDTVVITTPGYFEKVADVIRETNKEVLANYMIWSFIDLASFYLPESFGKARMEFLKLVQGFNPITVRETLCSRLTLLSLAIANSAILIDRYYEQNTTTAVRSMLDEVQRQFIINLDNVSWLDNDTRLAVKEKADAMGKFVGHPEVLGSVEYVDNYYMDFDVKPGLYFDNFLQLMAFTLKRNSDKLGKYHDQNEWAISPDKTQAYNVLQLNAIFLPAGLLRYPIFSILYPKPYYYGGIGSIGGHEMTHGFDDRGKKYTKTGAFTSQWWTNASLEAFNNLSSCFVEFFGKYEVQGLKLNGTITLGENLADSGGLKYAYKAFKAVQRDDDFTLPDLELSPDQLFFLGFSQNWCFDFTPAYEKHSVLNSVHTLHRFRVLGTISNSREFAKAFNCTPNSRMNPVTKCEVW